MRTRSARPSYRLRRRWFRKDRHTHREGSPNRTRARQTSAHSVLQSRACQGRNAPAHIGVTRREPHAHTKRERNHVRLRADTISIIRAASVGTSTRTRSPLLSSISILAEPRRDVASTYRSDRLASLIVPPTSHLHRAWSKDDQRSGLDPTRQSWGLSRQFGRAAKYGRRQPVHAGVAGSCAALLRASWDRARPPAPGTERQCPDSCHRRRRHP